MKRIILIVLVVAPLLLSVAAVPSGLPPVPEPTPVGGTIPPGVDSSVIVFHMPERVFLPGLSTGR